jgi:hypothetical protein
MKYLIKFKGQTALITACLLGCSIPRPTVTPAEAYLSPEALRSPEQAVSRSTLYAKKMRIDLSGNGLPVVEHYANAYPTFLDSDDATSYKTRLRSKLRGRDYWVVHYSPRHLQLGGDQVFFLEASTGALLAHYAGR